MKKIALFTLCFSLLVGVLAAPTTATWYTLNLGEECVAIFVLEGGKSMDVEFSGDKYMFVGFKTDASLETCKKYYGQPPPILLRVKGVNSFVGSIAGAGGVFSSVDGKFRFVAENRANIPFKIMVFKRKPDGKYE